MADNIATKYRPKELTEYIGNRKMKLEIERLLDTETDHLPSSFLFVGTSGCGKTTIARIIAKRYLETEENRESFQHYIETGDATGIENLNEIDVGQDRGIANMEAIKEDMLVPSFDGGWKVYIFDEFHASSRASQNALLKLLEDTPEKVLMIFCTTAKSQILPTILGRIQHNYRVDKPSMVELAKYLEGICKKENWKYDAHGLQEIAKLSNYQIRDAIRNLNEVVSTHGDAKKSSVADKFDLITEKYAKKFVEAYKSRNYLQGCDLINTIKTRYNLEGFYTLLKDYILRGIYVRNGVLVEGFEKKELDQYRKIFSDLTVGEMAGLLEDMQSLTGYSNSEQDLEIHLIMMTVRGIPDHNPDSRKNDKISDEESKTSPKVNMKKVEDEIKKGHKEEATKEVEKKQKSTIESLSEVVRITENLEMFGGKVYRIEC